ncbi:MAG: hypothetical protein HYU67_12215 [Flavobacteriia bacterium]|nr:hypothetical protein [Flavobacteriia bacterium]
MDNTNINTFIKKWKSGKHFFLDNENNSDYYSALNQYINESILPDENILLPRVILLFETIEQLNVYISTFEKNPINKDLICCEINEKKNKIKLRNDLYQGVDVIYGTIPSVMFFYLQNGISLSILKWMYIELNSKKHFASLIRIMESMKKGQLLLCTNKKIVDSLIQMDSLNNKISHFNE